MSATVQHGQTSVLAVMPVALCLLVHLWPVTPVALCVAWRALCIVDAVCGSALQSSTGLEDLGSAPVTLGKWPDPCICEAPPTAGLLGSRPRHHGAQVAQRLAEGALLGEGGQGRREGQGEGGWDASTHLGP